MGRWEIEEAQWFAQALGLGGSLGIAEGTAHCSKSGAVWPLGSCLEGNLEIEELRAHYPPGEGNLERWEVHCLSGEENLGTVDR